MRRLLETTWSAVRPPPGIVAMFGQPDTYRDVILLVIAAIAILAVLVGRI